MLEHGGYFIRDIPTNYFPFRTNKMQSKTIAKRKKMGKLCLVWLPRVARN